MKSARILFVCFIGISLLWACRRVQHGLNPGDLAPDISLADTQGTSHKLSDYRGKLVLLNFWATWCATCLSEMPALEELHKKFSRQGLVVLGVAVNDERDKVSKFLLDHHLTFPVLLDQDGKAERLFSLRGTPESFLINQQGKLVMAKDPDSGTPVVRFIGPKAWSSGEGLKTVLSLLSGKEDKK